MCLSFENVTTINLFHSVCFKGGCCGSTNKKTVVGSWAWAWWLVTDVQRMSLEVIIHKMMTGW
jgi:flotillin